MSELTGDALKVAVAVKLGFTVNADGKTKKTFGTAPADNIALKLLPGYDWDLNAMAEAERVYVIPKKLGREYSQRLDDECGNDYGYYHATAIQRARAFLSLP